MKINQYKINLQHKINPRINLIVIDLSLRYISIQDNDQVNINKSVKQLEKPPIHGEIHCDLRVTMRQNIGKYCIKENATMSLSYALMQLKKN